MSAALSEVYAALNEVCAVSAEIQKAHSTNQQEGAYIQRVVPERACSLVLVGSHSERHNSDLLPLPVAHLCLHTHEPIKKA